jgi:hypothetical protein
VAVEGEQMHCPRVDRRLGGKPLVHREGLKLQMDAVIGAEAQCKRLPSRDHGSERGIAAQPRLAGQRHTMKCRGDAVGKQVRVSIDQREVLAEIATRPRLHLAFERITMDGNEAQREQQPLRAQRARLLALPHRSP